MICVPFLNIYYDRQGEGAHKVYSYGIQLRISGLGSFVGDCLYFPNVSTFSKILSNVVCLHENS